MLAEDTLRKFILATPTSPPTIYKFKYINKSIHVKTPKCMYVYVTYVRNIKFKIYTNILSIEMNNLFQMYQTVSAFSMTMLPVLLERALRTFPDCEDDRASPFPARDISAVILPWTSPFMNPANRLLVKVYMIGLTIRLIVTVFDAISWYQPGNLPPVTPGKYSGKSGA